MTSRADPYALRWLVGVELRRFRTLAGMGTTAAANAHGCSQGKVAHLENGRHQQQPDDIAGLLRIYGAPDDAIEKLVELADFTDDRVWWAPWRHVVPSWFRLFLGLEGLAQAEFIFAPVLLPGLLQTTAYSGALFSSTSFVRPDHRDQIAAVRAARADRLTGDDPLELHAIFEENALQRVVGNAEVMQAQFRHLLVLAQRPNVTIQILRPEDGGDTHITGEFITLSFANAGPLAYVELIDDSVYITEPHKVNSYTMAAESLKATALDPAASIALIESLCTKR